MSSYFSEHGSTVFFESAKLDKALDIRSSCISSANTEAFININVKARHCLNLLM
jgi:hypothetical protein